TSVATLRGLKRQLRAVAFDASSRLLVGTNDDGRSLVWAIRSGREVGHVGKPAQRVAAGAFSADSKSVVVIRNAGTVLDLARQRFPPLRGEPLSVTAVAVSRDGARVATASYGSVWVRRISGGRVSPPLRLAGTNTAAFSGDGRLLATGWALGARV